MMIRKGITTQLIKHSPIPCYVHVIPMSMLGHEDVQLVCQYVSLAEIGLAQQAALVQPGLSPGKMWCESLEGDIRSATVPDPA